MISDTDPYPLDTERIYLDICTPESIIILTYRSLFDKHSRQDRIIGRAERGAKLHVEGVGSMDGEKNIYICPNRRHNILSLPRLNEWCLGFLGVPDELRENLYRNAIVQAVSYQTAGEKLHLWHYRLGRLPIPRIADAHRR